MALKIIAISDTHDQHDKIKINPCDILVHTGDITKFGSRKMVKKFGDWFAQQPATHKLVIAGNHDLGIQKHPDFAPKFFGDLGIHYLCDSGVTIRGINFYGTPWTPRWGPWAFMEDRSSPELKKRFDAIPSNTDVLLCHGPPLGYGDFNGRQHVGCELLLLRIIQVKPKVVCCGHIHENYGAFYTDFGTMIVNSAQLNFLHMNVNRPVELMWEAHHD
jgi:Icc-related predicted phosphoesterase